MNFTLPSKPEELLKLVGPIIGLIVALLTVVGIVVGTDGSSKASVEEIGPSPTTKAAATTSAKPTDKPKTPTAKPSATTKKAAPKEELNTFANGVLNTADYRFEITGTEVVQPGEKGNIYADGPVMIVKYKLHNKSPKEMTTLQWNATFQAVQDNDPNVVNTLKTAMYYEETPRFFVDIKPGGTVESQQVYELTDDVTPVTLKAFAPFTTYKFGEQTYPVK